MADPTNFSNRDLANLVKGWLVDTVRTEIDKNFPARPKEELDTMLRPDGQPDDAARQVRARRFREALVGLESLVMGTAEIEYRPVLDRVLHNIGANLQAQDMLVPQMGLENAPTFDYRALSTFPALVRPRRFIALPRTTQTLAELGMARYWPLGASVYLTEYREWQPRLWRSPSYDDERIGLFAWANLYSRDAVFFPMGAIPKGRVLGGNEFVMITQRVGWLARLIEDSPSRAEHVFRLSARDFTTLLCALLLDYETLHTTRQREVAEQDQLGALLWDFLSKED